jgi:hypothetical protein
MKYGLLLGFALLVSGCSTGSDGPICQLAGDQVGAAASYDCLDDQGSTTNVAELLPSIDHDRVNGAQ